MDKIVEIVSGMDGRTALLAVLLIIVMIAVAARFIFVHWDDIKGFAEKLTERRRLVDIVYENREQIATLSEIHERDREESLAMQRELTSNQDKLSNLVSEIAKSEMIRDKQVDLLKIASRELLAEKNK